MARITCNRTIDVAEKSIEINGEDDSKPKKQGLDVNLEKENFDSAKTGSLKWELQLM